MNRQAVISLLAIPALLVAFTATRSTAAPSTRQAAQTQAPKTTAPTATPVKVELVDINAATKEQLAALPGIGNAYSQKIIDGRPYKTKTELKTKHVLTTAQYTKIASSIVVKQPAK